MDGKHHQIDLSLVQASGQMETSSVAAAQARPGDILIGKIVKGKGEGTSAIHKTSALSFNNEHTKVSRSNAHGRVLST